MNLIKLKLKIFIQKNNNFFQIVNKKIINISYSISFFALKYLLKYNTCQVASPKRQHMENIEKYKTLLFVDSKKKEEK